MKKLIIVFGLILMASPVFAGWEHNIPVSTDVKLPIQVFDSSDGSEVGGKVHSDTTVEYCSEDGNSWTAYDDDGHWVDIDDGTYWLEIGASEFTSAGKRYIIRVAIDGCDTYRTVVYAGPAAANITQVAGNDVVDNDDGRLEVNIEEIHDAAVDTATAQLGVNVVSASNDAIEDADIASITVAAVSITEAARTSITGGAYDLDTDANGRIRIVDGTGTGEINTDGGKIVEVSTLTGHTAQTGDSYAVVTNVNYGLSVIEAQTDDIGIAGAGLTAIDLPNQTMDITGSITSVTNMVSANVTQISGDSTAADNAELAFDGTGFGFTNCTMPTITTLTNKTGFTAAPTAGSITSASFDGSTAYPLAAASSTLATASELTKVPKSDGTATWNSTALASLQAEAADALNVYDPPTKTEMDTAFTEIKGATFSTETDQLEDIRNRGDSAWITATGFSTHNAADVKTAMEADGSKLDHVWEMTEDDGGVRRLTANALEQAPSVDWTTGEKEQIRDALGVDGTKTTATSGDMQAIGDIVSSATYGNAALKALLDDKPDTTDLTASEELVEDMWAAESRVLTDGSVVWNTIVEEGDFEITAEDAIRLLLSFLVGESSGGGTSTVIFKRAVDPDTTAITLTVDAVGNRSEVVFDVDDLGL